MLARAVQNWDRAMDRGDSLFVTVDGSPEDVRRVADVVEPWTGSVFRVGQALDDHTVPRMGVAANKNTGLELLMDNTSVERLWLSDDDTWPLSPASLVAHYNLDIGHSMVNWGWWRKVGVNGPLSYWRHPRGVALYVSRAVVHRVGGMVEEFGLGGHEHVEWSERIFNIGITPYPFISPRSYAEHNWLGAASLWHAEDMPQKMESLPSLRRRRDKITSIRRPDGAEANSNRVLAEMRGSTSYVPYHASNNSRGSATMSDN